MQKLKYKVIEKLNTMNATSGEINLLILLSKYQDEKGFVSGVYYKEVCEKLKISYQLFYDLLRSLNYKRIISYEKGSYLDYDVKILDNDFSNENFHDGYFNMNHKIFSNFKFFSLKAKEKLLAFRLMKILLTKDYIRDRQKSFIITKEKLTTEWTVFFRVSFRAMKGYLKSLKEFFYIVLKDGKYYITGKREVYDRNQQTEEEQYNEFRIRKICRREKVNASTEKIMEFAKAINRKSQKLCYVPKEKRETTLTELLVQAIKKSVEKYKGEERCLNPAYVHSILNKLIGYQ